LRGDDDSPPPTRQEILEKYRDVIERDDFELLLQGGIPTPAAIQAEGATLTFLGRIRGFAIFLKRHAWGALLVLVSTLADMEDSLQFVERVCEVAPQVVAAAKEKLTDAKADTFLVASGPALPNGPADIPPRREFFMLVGQKTATATLTTQFFDAPLPTGTSITPVSRANFRVS
jgi:hypothetical protein